MNSDNSESDSHPSTPVKRRGRPVIAKELHRNVRYIKCEHCDKHTSYDYRDKTNKRDPVVDRDLSPKSKRRVYAKRHRDKKNEKKIEQILNII